MSLNTPSSALVESLRRDVERARACWDLSPSTRIVPLCLSENATFLATDPRVPRRTRSGRAPPRTIVVRVHRPDYHERDEILSELAWIDALRDAAVVDTPAPLATVDGARVACVGDGANRRHAVAFDFMSGRAPAPDAPLDRGFRALGAVSARLHAHARGWARPEAFRRRTWNLESIVGDTPHWGRWQDAPGLDAGDRIVLERALAVVVAGIERHGDAADRFGLVHADLRLANLLIDGERLGVIDFDDCGFGWFMADFAASASFVEERPDLPILLDAWCAGYRTVAPLDADAVAVLPLFVMLRRFQLTAWLATRSETDTARAFGAGYPAGTVRLARRLLERGTPLPPPARGPE